MTTATKNNRIKGIERFNPDSEVLGQGSPHLMSLTEPYCMSCSEIVKAALTQRFRRRTSRPEQRLTVSFPLPVQSHLCSCIFCQPRHQLTDVLISPPHVGTSQLTYTTIYARNSSKCCTNASSQPSLGSTSAQPKI